MRVLMFAFFTAGVALLIAGCDAPDADLDQVESATSDGKADSLDSASTYFSAAHDFRKCAWPLCGGWFVQRVNKANTKCSDGVYRAECYVATIDVSGLGFSGDEESDAVSNATAELFRANLGSFEWNGTRVGALKVQEVWRNASSETVATGTFYRVDPNQIRCITFPCPAQYHEVKLNDGKAVTLTGFVGSFADKLSGLSEVVLAAGENKTVKGKKVLDASQFWLRLVPAN